MHLPTCLIVPSLCFVAFASAKAETALPLQRIAPSEHTLTREIFQGAVSQESLSPNSHAIRVECGPEWASAGYLSVDLSYRSDHSGVLLVTYFVDGAKDPSMTMRIGLFPDTAPRIVIPLGLLDGQTVFPPRTPGRLKMIVLGSRVDRRKLTYVAIGLLDSGGREKIEISGAALHEREPEYPLPSGPVIDEMGQWLARDWPGKFADSAAMIEYLRGQRATATSEFPKRWSRYGGSMEIRFKASGYFRTEQRDGRWWLADPEGYAFFSTGLDSVTPGEETFIVPGTDAWHTLTASQRAGLTAALITGPNGRETEFNYGIANLIRAFGGEWRNAWEEITAARLRKWRFNTVANWSSPGYGLKAQLPYVTTLELSHLKTNVLLFRDFPDVFSSEFREAARTYAAPLEKYRGDRLLIGYFMGNEPTWGFGSFNLAAEMLMANPGSDTRRELARWIKARHGEQAWALAWNTARPLADIVEANWDPKELAGETVQSDLWEFSKVMVHEYVGRPAGECRKVDPDHLNLGMRFAWASSDLFYEAARYFDVFSLNHYYLRPRMAMFEEVAQKSGKPLLVGEYHFGAIDRGLPSTGLVGVASQIDRGKAYRTYLEMLAAHPAIVGAHYFILNDQAVLGRRDGENYQIGFVDTCHREYEEMVGAATLSNERIYDVHAGAAQAVDMEPQSAPAIAF